MSNPSRREKVEALLAENPNDTTLRYMLAMELEIEGEHERSLEAFGALIKESPAYVAAFFMSAKQLARLGRTDEAREI
ncbi:MAG: tetratricopeptide repeat protein, partial [Planctomycetes bacterium]|nr:tetratricopeptide repeat protein [Planctomycetota bacterium]